MGNHNRLSSSEIYFWAVAVLLYLPILLLIVFSFNDSTLLSFPLKGFTTRWYQEAFQNRQLLRSLSNSLLVAFLSSAVATFLGFLSALAVIRFRFPGKNFFIGVSAMPLVVPYVVLGVSILLAFRALRIPLSLWSVIIAHIVISLPEALIFIAARIVDFPSNLEEAAMDLGASYWQTLLQVTVPLSAPALIAAFLTCFTLSFNEFAVSFFVIGKKATLPIYIFSQLRISERVPMVIALAAMTMVVSVLILVFAEWLRRFGASAPRKGAL